MRAAIAGLERASVDDRCGVILLGPDERIEFASSAARRLLLEYFDSRSDQVLAPDLAKWLESGSAMLVRRLADRWVTVERSGDALLLMETRNELTLTPREREILTWVARGKTNAEVAQISLDCADHGPPASSTETHGPANAGVPALDASELASISRALGGRTLTTPGWLMRAAQTPRLLLA